MVFGSIDPVAAIFSLIAIILAIPSAIIAYRQLRKKRGSNSGPSLFVKNGGLFLAATVVLVLFAIILVTLQPSKSDTASPYCTSPEAVNIDGGIVDDDVRMVIHIAFNHTDDCRYLLIAQPRDTDVDPKNPHPEYYLSSDMYRPDTGDLSLTSSAARIGPTEVLRYYVISVDDNGYALFRSQLGSRNFATELPPGAHVVSNQLAITKPSSQSATSTTTSRPATSTTPSQITAAVIVYPPDNEAVPQRIAAKGTVANLRSGYALFLALDYDGCYFAQSVQVNGSEWSTEMDIGGAEVASGHEFTLSAVTTDQDLTQAQSKQASGCFKSLDDLKEKYGVIVLTTNQITRK